MASNIEFNVKFEKQARLACETYYILKLQKNNCAVYENYIMIFFLPMIIVNTKKNPSIILLIKRYLIPREALIESSVSKIDYVYCTANVKPTWCQSLGWLRIDWNDLMVQLFLPDVRFGVVSSVTEGFRAHVVWSTCEGSRQVTWPHQQTGHTKVTLKEDWNSSILAIKRVLKTKKKWNKEKYIIHNGHQTSFCMWATDYHGHTYWDSCLNIHFEPQIIGYVNGLWMTESTYSTNTC